MSPLFSAPLGHCPLNLPQRQSYQLHTQVVLPVAPQFVLPIAPQFLPTLAPQLVSSPAMPPEPPPQPLPETMAPVQSSSMHDMGERGVECVPPSFRAHFGLDIIPERPGMSKGYLSAEPLILGARGVDGPSVSSYTPKMADPSTLRLVA